MQKEKQYANYLSKVFLETTKEADQLFFIIDEDEHLEKKKIWLQKFTNNFSNLITEQQLEYAKLFADLTLQHIKVIKSIITETAVFEKEKFNPNVLDWYYKTWVEIHQIISEIAKTDSYEFIASYRSEQGNKEYVSKKLNWTGNKNQLYAVIRQLKESKLIGNTYDDLANFIQENITGFEKMNRGTLERELKRKKSLPHSKRINLNIETED